MAISQQTTDALKKKYATADALQSSAEFSKLTPEMQKTALWVYTPDIQTMSINDKVKSGVLDVSQATIEPVKPTVQPQAEVKQDAPATVVAPTPAKVEKQEEIKTPEQIQAEQDKIRYNDDSEQRLNEISANLNDAVTKNPNSLKTLEAFKNTYSVDKNIRSAKQVQSMLDRYAWYQKWVNLGLTPVNDIMTWYTNGTITATDLESLRSSNPTKYAEVQTAIENKKELKKFQEELYGVKESTIWVADTTTDVDDPNLFDEYKAAINSDEAKALNTSIADQDWKISQLKLKLLDIEKDVEKRYEWTGATKGKIAYIVAKEQAEIQKQISELSIDMNTSINKYNSIVNTAKDIMTLGLQEKTAAQQERQVKMQELWFFYQYTPEGMAQMATAKYNAENPDLDSTNVGTSTMALNQTLDAYYEDFGDIIQRPKAQVVNDVINYAKSKGISISQALKENFITPLQNKPEYKSMLGKKYGTEKSIVNINWVDYQYDSATNTYSLPNVPSALTSPIDLTNPVWLWDLSTSTLVTAYPNEASFKNNNPTGIKMSASDTLKKMWTDAWISFWEWTVSPEWWKYVKFATMEDWLKAYKIALSSRGDDVYARLKQWKGVWDTEWYANQIMSEAGIEKLAKFSSLSPEKMNALMNAHLKRESSGLYKYMQWVWWTVWTNKNESNFEAYMKSFSEKKNGTLAFGWTEKERLQALKDMWYTSWADFNVEYEKRLQTKAQEQPEPWFTAAVKYVTENPLFDYTDENWQKQKGLLWKQWFIDSRTISQIEDNLMKWEKWDKWLWIGIVANLNKFPQIWNFIESLKTIRNSKVIDIVKSGKVKLYPMSDADIWLLAWSVWLQVNSFAEPSKAKSTMIALKNLLNAYNWWAAQSTNTTNYWYSSTQVNTPYMTIQQILWN